MFRSVISLLLLVPALACAGEPAVGTPGVEAPQQVVASFAEVDVHDLKRLLEVDDVVIVDVRTAAEFADGHMPGAINIDVKVLGRSLDRLAAYREQPVYVSCRTSNRSRVGSQVLVDAGFTDVTQVLGGFSEWQASGYTVER